MHMTVRNFLLQPPGIRLNGPKAVGNLCAYVYFPIVLQALMDDLPIFLMAFFTEFIYDLNSHPRAWRMPAALATLQ
jgi:hypothetical protein